MWIQIFINYCSPVAKDHEEEGELKNKKTGHSTEIGHNSCEIKIIGGFHVSLATKV